MNKDEAQESDEELFQAEDGQVCVFAHGITPGRLECLSSCIIVVAEVVDDHIIGGWQMSHCEVAQEIEQAHGWSKEEHHRWDSGQKWKEGKEAENDLASFRQKVSLVEWNPSEEAHNQGEERPECGQDDQFKAAAGKEFVEDRDGSSPRVLEDDDDDEDADLREVLEGVLVHS